MSKLANENQKRFIAVISKKVDTGRALNVLGHISVGLTNQLNAEDTCFVDYVDQDGNVHPSISHYPFIVLKADNSNKIRRLKADAKERGIPFTDFTNTMIEGGSEVQQRTTANTAEVDLEYLGIGLFGDVETLRDLTKKFSLYR